jgi:hypothetical protein
MSELARTPTPLKRLFEEVDLAPMPQSAPALDALAYCARRRKGGPVDFSTGLKALKIRSVAPHALIAEAVDGNYALKGIGETVGGLLDAGPQGTLAKAKNRRLAARLRRAFDAAWIYGDPVVFQFHLRARRNSGVAIELLVIPLNPRSAIPKVLAVLATRSMGAGW